MLTAEERIERRRLHNRRYREENRASINARIRAKKLRQRAIEMPLINEQLNITKKEIAKLIGVKMLTLEKILKDKKFNAPKHTGVHFDGTVLFNRKEVMEWMPYIREASVFIKKGKLIVLSGMSAQIVHFMRKNKKIEKYCDEIRRKEMDGRSNNG